MKKTVLTYGMISGAISALMLIGTTVLLFNKKTDDVDFSKSMYLGYASMILSFTLIYFAQASYRDHQGSGYISFGRAFSIGILIAIISSLCYVVAWLIVYYNFFPDFM